MGHRLDAPGPLPSKLYAKRNLSFCRLVLLDILLSRLERWTARSPLRNSFWSSTCHGQQQIRNPRNTGQFLLWERIRRNQGIFIWRKTKQYLKMNVLGLYEHEYIHIYAHICVDLYMYTYVNKLHSMCEKKSDYRRDIYIQIKWCTQRWLVLNRRAEKRIKYRGRFSVIFIPVVCI